MPKGNPNPSPATRFKKGQSGNPGGVTSDVIAMGRANAAAAIRIRARLLHAMEAKLAESDMDAALALLLDPNALRAMKDAEDRGLGAPVQPITSPDGTMTPAPTIVHLIAVKPDDHAGD